MLKLISKMILFFTLALAISSTGQGQENGLPSFDSLIDKAVAQFPNFDDRVFVQNLLHLIVSQEILKLESKHQEVDGFKVMKEVRALMETDRSEASAKADEVAALLLSDISNFNENVRYIVTQIENYTDENGPLTEKEDNRLNILHISVFYMVSELRVAHIKQQAKHAITGGAIGLTSYLGGHWIISKVKSIFKRKKTPPKSFTRKMLVLLGSTIASGYAGYKAGDFFTKRYVNPAISDLHEIDKIDLLKLRNEILEEDVDEVPVQGE